MDSTQHKKWGNGVTEWRQIGFANVMLLLVFTGCEFFNDPYEVPFNEFVETIYLEPNDTLAIDISSILNRNNNINLEISSAGNSSVVEVIELTFEELTVFGRTEGESTVIVECNDGSERNRIFFNIHVIEGKPLFLKTGEVTELNPQDIFEMPGVYPDSVILEDITEGYHEFPVNFEYIYNESIKMTGSFPGQVSGILKGYYAQDIIEVRLHIVTEIRHVVLTELFTSTTCTNCPEANEIVDNYLEEHASSLAVIRYHLGTPAPGDPMYAYNMEESDSRLEYYMPFQIAPFLTIDGSTPFVGVGPITNSTATLIERFQTPTDIYLGHEVEESDSTLDVTMRVSGLQVGNIYTLQAVLIENEVLYEGSNGETHHRQVMRDFNALSISRDDIVDLTLMKPDWYTGDTFNVVTFLQNEETREVIQANIHHKLLLDVIGITLN